jgi:hypothetical protein
MGAAQQLWLLYRNHQEISDLQNLRRCRALEVPIRELVENKEQQLKKKQYAPHISPSQPTRKTSLRSRRRQGSGPLARLPMVAVDCCFRFGSVPAMRGMGLSGPKPQYNAVLPSTFGLEERLRHEKSSASLQVRPSQEHSRTHVFQDEPHQSTQEL